MSDDLTDEQHFIHISKRMDQFESMSDDDFLKARLGYVLTMDICKLLIVDEYINNE